MEKLWYKYTPTEEGFKVSFRKDDDSFLKSGDIEKLRKKLREIETANFGYLEFKCEMDDKGAVSEISHKTGAYGLRRAGESCAEITYKSFNCDNGNKVDAVWKAFCVWMKICEEAVGQYF